MPKVSINIAAEEMAGRATLEVQEDCKVKLSMLSVHSLNNAVCPVCAEHPFL